jgi:hypothetical protein
MQHSVESIFVVEYLREYESVFETAFAHESVDQWVGIVWRNNPEAENLVRCPFKRVLD